MRSTILLGGALLIVSMGSAMAQCASPMSLPTLRTLLANNTACIGSTPNAEWSEWHNGNGTAGTLVDWKKGPSDRNDPTSNVGTYTTSAQGMLAGKVTYTYGSNSYSYVVQAGSGPVYTFCPLAGGANLSVMIKPGQGPC
jgi:hypothetical protein